MDSNGQWGSIPPPPPPPPYGNGRGVVDQSVLTVQEGVTLGHPEGDLDGGGTLQAPSPAEGDAQAPATPVEPTQGFPGRARRSEMKTQQKAEFADAKRTAKAEKKVAQAEARETRQRERHEKKLARLERRKSERVPFADRHPTLAKPIPPDRTWFITAGGVFVAGLALLGTWRATGTKPLNINVEAVAPLMDEPASPPTTEAGPVENPLASVSCPITPNAATIIAFDSPYVEATLSSGQRAKLSAGVLQTLKLKLLEGPGDPKTAQLDSPDPLKPPKVVWGQSNTVPLFDCSAVAARPAGS